MLQNIPKDDYNFIIVRADFPDFLKIINWTERVLLKSVGYIIETMTMFGALISLETTWKSDRKFDF